MFSEDVDELKAKRICYACVGETYLSDEIRTRGKRAKCDYCGKVRRSYGVGEMAERVQTAFDQHYRKTSDQPNDWQFTALRDPESSYEWSRDGEPVIDAVMYAAEIPQQAAEDIQRILDDEHSDLDLAAIGEETEFAEDSYYDAKPTSDEAWQEEWQRFDTSLKTEARFFSRTAVRHLVSIFDGVDRLSTRDDKPLVVDAGPGTAFHMIYRARVFQSEAKLEEALRRPDIHLGSPPPAFANAGRMNARGISVFYGANDPKTAIAEVRPPVGSQAAVAQFEIIRPLRLLDLTALKDVSVAGSIFDPEFAGRLERAVFLETLSDRITRPVMPDDEVFEYLATQAVADFLSTETSVPIDGIIYPSVQVAGAVRNVVLFHKAARVEPMSIPEGTEIRARTGHWDEEGWAPEYAVIEEVPPAVEKPEGAKVKELEWPDFDRLPEFPDPDADWREAGLRIMPDSVMVHRIKWVDFGTDEFAVTRHRWEKRDIDF